VNYHSLADFVGRTLLARTEGLGPAALVVQIFRVLPGGLVFLLISVGGIVIVSQWRPQRLWIFLVGLILCNALLLLWSVAEDYRQLDDARRKGGVVSSNNDSIEERFRDAALRTA
jgi:hypothetical protein